MPSRTAAGSSAQRAPGGGSCTARAVPLRPSAMPHQQVPAKRSRLQLLLDLSQAIFAQPGEPTPKQIEALCNTLGAIPLEELGLQAHAVDEVESSSSSRSSSPGVAWEREGARGAPDAAPRPPITYLLIYEDARVSLGVFCLPARAKIPLHNHPGMTVLSRMLYGHMHVTSYDFAAPAQPASPCSSDGGSGGDGGGGGLPREARVVVDRTLTRADAPTVLFPHSGGNIHEFTALTDCAVLDLMSPPYSTEEGRDCTYYSVLADPLGRANRVLLDAYEPPVDFVINQGSYRGVQPRPKTQPSGRGGPGQPRRSSGEFSPMAADSGAARGPTSPQLTPPAPLSPMGTPPTSSPTSEHTGGPKLSSLLGSAAGSGGPADCAASHGHAAHDSWRITC